MSATLLVFLTILNSTAGLYFENVQIGAQVTNHLCETTLVMKVHNDGACPTEDTFDLQLPVTSFLSKMILTEEKTNCTFTGTFLAAEKAQAGFDGAVKAGDSAALIKSYEVGQVSLSLSMPANTTSTLTITYTEVLHKESGKVSLQIPINLSGKHVKGDIEVNITVHEHSGVEDMQCSASRHKDETEISPVTTFAEINKQLSILIRGHDKVVEGLFSTVITCVYTPKVVPNGLLLVNDDRHFFFLYAPPTPGVTAVHKAIHFVIDLSGSMAEVIDGQSRLQIAKQAFKYMIGLLSPNDYFSVSTFDDSMTVGAFGPSRATESAIAAATRLVDGLQTYGATNLHDAVVLGIRHARSLLVTAHDAAPVLLLLTDGQATAGNTNGRDIVSDALTENQKGETRVPVYALAMGRGADEDLLQALATTNGGDTLRIYEGFGDTINQMQKFYEDNLKHILMRKVTLELQNAVLQSNTDMSFPILNAGSDIVVTGRVQLVAPDRSRRALADLSDYDFAIQMHGIGPDGPVSLTTTAMATPSGDSARVSESITRMHAYKLVKELMRNSQTNKYMGRHIKAEEERASALAITLDAGLLWPGLTSMLVVADEICKNKMVSEECSLTATTVATPAPCIDNCMTTTEDWRWFYQGSSAGNSAPRQPLPHIATHDSSSGGSYSGVQPQGAPNHGVNQGVSHPRPMAFAPLPQGPAPPGPSYYGPSGGHNNRGHSSGGSSGGVHPSQWHPLISHTNAYTSSTHGSPDTPATASASPPSTKVCPQCGINQKTGKLNCCASGGSWFNTCGDIGDSTFEHTWGEGMRACMTTSTATTTTEMPVTTANVITTRKASRPCTKVCPQCGINKKTGKRSCCARGGSWFKNCGDVGDSTFEHTWGEGMRICMNEPATTSASPPSTKVCPQCGINQKTGKLNCCASGGSWFNNCGEKGDSQFEHTWGEGMRACKNAPATTSASPPSTKVCPQCGINQKSGKRSCCASGGSWFNNCGEKGDSQFEHTWGEGMRVCQSLELVQSILPPLSNISILEQTPTREGIDMYFPGGVSNTLCTDSVDYLVAVAIFLVNLLSK